LYHILVAMAVIFMSEIFRCNAGYAEAEETIENWGQKKMQPNTTKWQHSGA